MKKTLLVLLVAVALPMVFAPAAPAASHKRIPTPLPFSITSATLSVGGNIQLSGNITCPLGKSYSGRIAVLNPTLESYTAADGAHVTTTACTGSSQVWTAKATPYLGSMTTGSAEARAHICILGGGPCQTSYHLQHLPVTIV